MTRQTRSSISISSSSRQQNSQKMKPLKNRKALKNKVYNQSRQKTKTIFKKKTDSINYDSKNSSTKQLFKSQKPTTRSSKKSFNLAEKFSINNNLSPSIRQLIAANQVSSINYLLRQQPSSFSEKCLKSKDNENNQQKSKRKELNVFNDLVKSQTANQVTSINLLRQQPPSFSEKRLKSKDNQNNQQKSKRKVLNVFNGLCKSQLFLQQSNKSSSSSNNNSEIININNGFDSFKFSGSAVDNKIRTRSVSSRANSSIKVKKVRIKIQKPQTIQNVKQKNYCRYLIEMVLKNAQDYEKQMKEILDMSQKDINYFIKNKKDVTISGPRAFQKFLINDDQSQEDQMIRLFKKFATWFLEKMAMRYISKRGYYDKTDYVRYKNKILIPMIQNPKKFNGSQKQ